MATGQLNSLVRHIHRIALGRDSVGMTDGELLKRFVAHQDKGAFEALVRRYGPLVLGVCRRVLHQRQDAEDAFQATFLVLLHKASSIAQPELVGNWLYGVAHYTAKNAKASAARRRARERGMTEMPRAQLVADEDGLQELRPLLDEEISRLPEKYRVPVVLCELQGKSRKEVARHVGCPEGTISSRLARARQLLRQRLLKRGLTLSAGSLAVALSQDVVLASVPAPLVSSTIKTAALIAASPEATAGVVSAQVAALTEGVLKTMFLAKLKTATAVLLAVSILTGAAMLTHQAVAAKQSDAASGAAQKAPGDENAKADPGKASRKPQLSAPKREAEEAVRVRGRVLDPDGKPVAGAKLYLGGYTSPKERKYPVRATSGDDGRFAFTFARAELEQLDADDLVYQVLAVAKGHGCAWVTADATAGDALTLRLV